MSKTEPQNDTEYLHLRGSVLSNIDDHDEAEQVGSAMDAAYRRGVVRGLERAADLGRECGVFSKPTD